MKLRILHISDLHYGKKGGDARKVMTAFFDDIKDYKIDLVIFSGDIVDSGTKDNFEGVKVNFIEKLLEILNLKIDDIFISPGNHDIDRSVIEDGELDFLYKSNINTKEKIKNLVEKQDIIQNSHYYSRLDNFNDFKLGLNQKVENINKLSSTHIIEKKGKKIGISCLSTALFCKGSTQKAGDYGNLIIGETQITKSLEKISKCDIKIATFHHDLKNINGIEQNDVKGILYSKYDLIMMGHYHNETIEENIINGQKIVLSYAGSLYFREDSFNGYSLVEINENNEGKIVFRNYVPNITKFELGNKVIKDGEIKFTLGCKENMDGINLRMYKEVEKISNNKLLSKSEDNLANKTIFDMFVEPDLYIKKEELNKERLHPRKEKIKLEDIRENNKSYFIVGRQESGKTTLVNHMILSLLNKNICDEKIPIYLKNIDLRKNKKIKLEILIRDYLNDLGVYEVEIPEIKEKLSKGKYVVFIDNLDVENNGEIVKELVEKYEENKFIITIQEKYGDVDNKLENEMIKLEINLQIVYIDFFNSKKVISLVEKWTKENGKQKKQAKEVIRSIDKMGIPKTPQIISLLLWISNEQQLYNITNKAVLLEKFFDIILEKLKLKKEFKIMDYGDRIHYLSYIAKKMSDEGVRSFSLRDLEDKTNSYLESLSLLNKNIKISEVVEYFIERGILFNVEGNISFKYQSFYEYFIAKKMSEDREYRDKILKDWDFINYPEELEFYSGIKRGDKEMLEFLSEKLSEGDNFFKEDNNLATYNLTINNFLTDKTAFTNTLSIGTSIGEEECEEPEEERVRMGHDSNKNNSCLDENYKYFICLQLLTNAFKNITQIEDKDFREKIFTKLIDTYSYFLIKNDKHMLLKINKNKERHLEIEGNDEKKLQRKVDVIRFLFTGIITEIMIENIISDRIHNFVSTKLNDEIPIKKFLLNVLFLDLHNDDSIKKILEYVEKENNKLFLEILNVKIKQYSKIKKCREDEVENIQKALKNITEKQYYLESLNKNEKIRQKDKIEKAIDDMIRENQRGNITA